MPGGGQGKSRAACGSFEIRVKIEADKKRNKITLSSPRTWGALGRNCGHAGKQSSPHVWRGHIIPNFSEKGSFSPCAWGERFGFEPQKNAVPRK